ncbi:hypothetical protein [Balneola sp. EhC07]|uniref:hypothetical protein n=1 Tax=Balneola sp. EhC07 TaxID=1849360 RepID=UPI0013725AFA|nr:hypothetical protein [Balneola sp. EhC07]
MKRFSNTIISIVPIIKPTKKTARLAKINMGTEIVIAESEFTSWLPINDKSFIKKIQPRNNQIKPNGMMRDILRLVFGESLDKIIFLD